MKSLTVVPPPFFKIMGILNCTPDSFSDGGQFSEPKRAVEHALLMAAQGANIIDLGAESTRPAAGRVSVGEEWERLHPVLRSVQRELPPTIALSVDTRKPEIMLRAADLGVSFINNVGGLADCETLEKLSRYSDLSYIAMHMHGQPESMQTEPLTGPEVVPEVARYFEHARSRLAACGFTPSRCYFDPGIGFGKNDQANLMLMLNTSAFSKKYKMVLGVSRKSWIGRLLGIDNPQLRDAPSKIAEVALVMAGAGIIRTHEVRSLSSLRHTLCKLPS